MFRITFAPIRQDTPLILAQDGDCLILNGEAVDFGAVAPGQTVPSAHPMIAGEPRRDEDGTLCLTVLLPHGPVAPDETLFPAPLEWSEDGEIPLPPYGG